MYRKMRSTPEEFSNIEINDEPENKPVIKKANYKEDSTSISSNSQFTNDNSKINFSKFSRKNEINDIQRSLTTLFLSNRITLYVEEEFFPDKKDNTFDITPMTKKNENKKNEEDSKITQNEKGKIEIKINKITVKEDSKNNVNNVKNDVLNKNSCMKNNENYNINKNINKDKLKKNDKNDYYTQTYCRNDFNNKSLKIPDLFKQNYDYKNENNFSHSNDTYGIIKEPKKVPNVFYNHLLLNNKNNERFTTISFNKNIKGKVVTFIFYAP